MGSGNTVSLSSYERYSDTAKAYDTTRTPVGLSVLLKSFGASSTPLNHQRILDLGCGTGNYLCALKDRVGSLVGLDGSREMLLAAAKKCGESATIELKQGSILELPFYDRQFDGVMINQVLHHLSASPGFQQCRQCLTEVFRVLKPGGVLCLSTCSQEQLKPNGPFWYYRIFSDAANYLAAKYAPIDSLCEMLSRIGFADPITQPDSAETFFVKERYFDLEGPFQKEWRDGDSAFAVYNERKELLENRLQELRQAIDDNSITNIVAASEQIREKLGQHIVIAVRRV